MFNMKKIMSSVLAVSIITVMGTTTSFAQEIKNHIGEENKPITISVENLKQLTKNSGILIMSEEDYKPKMRIAKNFSLTLTNENWNLIGSDNNMLPATAKIQVVTLSSNIDTVDIYLYEKHTGESVYSYGLTAGDWSNSIDVTMLNGYRGYIRANGNPKISSSNQGRVTVYWTDQNN